MLHAHPAVFRRFDAEQAVISYLYVDRCLRLKEIEHVVLGSCISNHRDHRGRSGLRRRLCRSGFNRSNSVLHLLGDLPCIAHYGLYRPSSPADMSRRDETGLGKQ